ncbi:sigma 54-interacting transcriptional regulator [Bacillus safensis]|uniref:sigma-54 interaction domain-containing protein n=1 Tax=Bacillus safensis TaxID=561879 RepID=UPI00203B9D56|nr:sigma 54-interacting transcriptional regulator [Bacillus safensis]MCM2989720.1 sigma 54-interacting transcriptional regulator [Bacillus safensis]
MKKDPYTEKLENEIDLYKQMLDLIDVGVHAIDENGNTVVYNKKMMEIESLKRSDVLNKNVLDLFVFQDEMHSTLVQALRTGKQTVHAKQTYHNYNGKEITTINHTYPLVLGGLIQGAVEISNDVTKLERLIHHNMKKKGSTLFTFDSIIGQSPAFLEVIEHAKRATRTSSYVLIVGETGTGKELFAQSIHNGSSRSSGPFITQNCAALPDNLIESLLFGTQKGAFTGAADQPGLFEQAQGGTLLLDEINSLNPGLQAKLLRVLQEKRMRRLGSTKEIAVDVRVIANMNEDPVDAIAGGRMRKDLFYRLGIVTLFIPPLSERKEDIPTFVSHFIQKYNELFQMKVKAADEEVLALFQAYDWPGNVRELEHVIEAGMNMMMDEDYLGMHHLPYHFRFKHGEGRPAAQLQTNPLQHTAAADTFIYTSPEHTTDFQTQMERFEKQYIVHYLEKMDDNISQTAKILGMSRQSLQYRMKKLHISR